MRIGLFLNSLDEEYQISIYKGIHAEAAALALDLICIQGETLFNYHEENGDEPFPSREFISVDGALILTSSIMNRAAVTPLPVLRRFFHVPLVSIGSRFPDIPSIVVRSRKSMELLMEHLIVFHGYRKLLYIGGPVQHPDNLVREHVFRRMVNSLKKELPGLEGRVINGEFHQTSAMMVLREYIDNCSLSAGCPEVPPDVIVAANDNIALGVLELLRIREDPRWRGCPVTGFDDIHQSRLETPALTTIRQPLEKMGRLAVSTLRDLMDGREVPRVIHVESELCIRNSCGCSGLKKRGLQERETAQDREVTHSQKNTPRAASTANNRPEYYLRDVSLLGQALVMVDSPREILPPLRFFLVNLAVKTFYLILYPEPLEYAGKTGNLIYRRTENNEFSQTDRAENMEMANFFSRVITEHTHVPGTRAWCVYHLRSGREYLGLIVYEASDRVYPQMCSAAIFLANTVKRLQIHKDEKEQAQRLEQEVAVQTKDLAETYQKLREEVQRRMAVEAEVLRISEMERLRFSMDLHDDICQRLAGISMFCKSLMPSLSPASFMPELSELIDETLARTRRYAHDSFPVELDTLGLKEALDALCYAIRRQNSCRCVFSWIAPEKSPYSSARDLNIYRIVQEALQNAVKHAGANRINVEVRTEDGIFSVTVRDNGTGDPKLNEEKLDTADIKQHVKRGGLGLRSMRYRARQLGAEYIFESSGQDGTRVEIRIPLPAQS